MPKVKEGDVCRIVNAPAFCGEINGRIVMAVNVCEVVTAGALMIPKSVKGAGEVWWHVDPDCEFHALPESVLVPLANPGDDEKSQELRPLPADKAIVETGAYAVAYSRHVERHRK